MKSEAARMPTNNCSEEPPAAPAAASEETVPLCVPEIRGNEWQYLKDCLDTNWVSSVGKYVDRFEEVVAQYVGSKFAVATSSGTSALHVALLVAGVEPGDEVLVSSLTFIAPANAIRYVDAWPVFMDAEPNYWQMDPEKVRDFLTKECQWRNGALRNKTTGRRMKALLPVHILGHPVDLDPILELADSFNLTVIEDVAEGMGAQYKGSKLGNRGDVSCLSFNGNKVITTGGGGMILTDNESLAQRAKYLTTQAKDDPVEYIHREIGFNYRLTNIQAAVGCAQMEYLDDYVGAKRSIAATYERTLGSMPGITCMSQASWAFSTYWMYTILIDEGSYGEDSRALMRRLGASRIQSRPLWQPMSRSKAHSGCQSYHCDVVDELYRRGLSLPCSVGLSDEQQQRVISAIGKTQR